MAPRRSPATWPSAGTPWTAGSRRTRRSRGTRATPTRASTCARARADTVRPKLLFETSLPTRIYVPRADVRTDLLSRSQTGTYCPYKGRASYWSARASDEPVEDVAWSYPEPFPEASKVRDHLSFLHEELVVDVDGAELEHLSHRR